MKLVRQKNFFPMLFVLCLAAGGGVEAMDLGHVEGRVLSRIEGGKPEPVKIGYVLKGGEALITGDASRFELVADGGVWRVGRRAIFFPSKEGARLLAGTALVQVPAGSLWRVSSRQSRLGLPGGTWVVQAVDNGGFKVVCLDSDLPIQGLGEADSAHDSAAELKLRPGDLVFLQPGGRTFSPVVTVFLQELLATSRLIQGFSKELPGYRRILNQALAQEDRVKTLSSAVVVGAPTPGSFQIALPTPTKLEVAEATTKNN